MTERLHFLISYNNIFFLISWQLFPLFLTVSKIWLYCLVLGHPTDLSSLKLTIMSFSACLFYPQFLSGQTTATTSLLTLLIIFKFKIIFYKFIFKFCPSLALPSILSLLKNVSLLNEFWFVKWQFRSHILVHTITLKGSHFNTLYSKWNNLRIMALTMVSTRVTCYSQVVMINLMQASVATHSTVFRRLVSQSNLYNYMLVLASFCIRIWRRLLYIYEPE